MGQRRADLGASAAGPALEGWRQVMVAGERVAFGVLLKRYRLDSGLTQEALAERARISTRAVSDLERDVQRLPRRDTAALLAGATGIYLTRRRPARPNRLARDPALCARVFDATAALVG